MSAATQVLTHEPPFVFGRIPLPRHTTLREIAIRAKSERTQWEKDKQYAKEFVAKIQLQGVTSLPKQELAQIWVCLSCTRARGWGYNEADDPTVRPVLNCKHCACPTRHGFLGVIGRTL